jgi:hypothetical protein
MIVCDLDGTVSDHSHRVHLVTGEKRDYDRYYALMGEDPPIKGVHAKLYQLVLRASPHFYFLTGRPERFRKLTEYWLFHHFGIVAVPPRFGVHAENEVRLVMRPEGDFRKAAVFKQELVSYLRGGGSVLGARNPVIAIDDDVRNEQMYRVNGCIWLRAPECWETMF